MLQTTTTALLLQKVDNEAVGGTAACRAERPLHC